MSPVPVLLDPTTALNLHRLLLWEAACFRRKYADIIAAEKARRSTDPAWALPPAFGVTPPDRRIAMWACTRAAELDSEAEAFARQLITAGILDDPPPVEPPPPAEEIPPDDEEPPAEEIPPDDA